MDEPNNSNRTVDEKGYHRISTNELIEIFKVSYRPYPKECLLKDTIFELEGNQHFDFKTLLSSAEVCFPSNDFFRVNIKIKFENCIFKSKVLFEKLSFENYQNLSFSRCILEKEISFIKCRFNELYIYGLNTIPSDKIKQSMGILTLNGCSANHKVSIFFANNSGIHLIENDFNLLLINSCVALNHIKILQNKIKENLTIYDCKIELLEFVLLKNQDYKIYLQDSDFNTKIVISEGIIDRNFIFRNCYLKNLKFGSAILDDAQIINCNFGDYILYDEQEMFGNDMNTKEQYNIILNQYKALEKNFDYYKNYEEAGEFHKRQFEVQRKFTKWNNLKKYILWLYYTFSGYGESYVRSIISFLSILFIFTILYLFTGLDYVNNANNIDDNGKSVSLIKWSDPKYKYNCMNDFGASLLFSLSNTLPIRKDIESIKPASEWTRFFAYIEVTLQSIILTLFIIALRRKFKR